jgi:hypothetical protein
MVSFTPQPLYPQGRAPGTHWIGGWVGPRTVLDVMVKRKIPSPCPELNPRTLIIQPIARCYTDWAITALRAAVLQNLKEDINEKWWGKIVQGGLILNSNAPVHKSWKTTDAIMVCGLGNYHPPCSLYLAPSDHILFWNLKKHSHRHWFSSDSELKGAVSQWFEEQDKDIYCLGISSLPQKWRKCIKLKKQWKHELYVTYFMAR